MDEDPESFACPRCGHEIMVIKDSDLILFGIGSIAILCDSCGLSIKKDVIAAREEQGSCRI